MIDRVKQLFFCIVILAHMPLISFSYDFAQYHVIDTSRQELYPHNAEHSYRECVMHVWIPVSQEQSYPLILFSHGLGDTFNGMAYTQLCEYCASQGYVVVSVSHTYGCKPIQLSDGTVTEYLFPAQIHQQPGKNMFDIEADMWVEDMICALDECARQNMCKASLLYNKIDMSHIGAMGHSLGGSVALQLCRRDNRITAVVNLDGPLYGTNVMYPIEKPLMVVIGTSDQKAMSTFHSAFLWRGYFNQFWLPLLNTYISSLNSDVYKVTIDGIVHDTFSDAALTPDPILIQWVIDGSMAHTMIHTYVGAFFDCYLKYSYVPLLQELISCWPNVTIEKSNLSEAFPAMF